MGSSPTKPEFVYVLGDKNVKAGYDVILSCEANTEDVTATWEKNGQKLQCVQGKHRVTHSGTRHRLEISSAEQGDEGNYEITLRNDSGSTTCSAMVTVELKEWRTGQWRQDPLIGTIRNFKLRNDAVKELRFLLHGPIGAGKSSIINTIKTIFEGHQFINCLTASTAGTSFTLTYKKFTVGSEQSGHLPLAFYDVMGLEKGQSKGVCTDDIIKALKGHIPNDYEFQKEYSMPEKMTDYITNPKLNDQIHCLVSVIAADAISRMDEDVITKMKLIREEASKLGIPQVLFMTRVDKACTLTQQDLGNIYKSKKIKEKMCECSNRLGITMNCIFPVMNYHEQITSNEKINCLMLEALTQIVNSAHDYVIRCSDTHKSVE